MSEGHPKRLIPRKTVKERLGNCSDMTIWRREQDPQARFPVPIVISGRCYYDEDEFSAWLSSRPRKCQRGDAGP
jgi:hypothetical protein